MVAWGDTPQVLHLAGLWSFVQHLELLLSTWCRYWTSTCTLCTSACMTSTPGWKKRALLIARGDKTPTWTPDLHLDRRHLELPQMSHWDKLTWKMYSSRWAGGQPLNRLSPPGSAWFIGPWNSDHSSPLAKQTDYLTTWSHNTNLHLLSSSLSSKNLPRAVGRGCDGAGGRRSHFLCEVSWKHSPISQFVWQGCPRRT